MSLTRLSRSIRGSRALITGAASGIGRATACLFADEGAQLALLDRNTVALAELKAEIEAAGGRVATFEVDLTERNRVTEVIGAAVTALGGLDILVNNAGLAIPAAIDAEDYPGSWDTSLAVMVEAQAWAARSALPALRESEHPRIINLSSTEGLGATRFNSAYVVAKHAAVGLTRALAVDLGKEGITVNAVCPGPVRTSITEAIPEADKQTFAQRRTALRRYADPEEIAHAILHLALPASSFITGATLVADGGVTIRNA
ncbi:MAG: SDR family oxidoreductase [Halieaceae bacterium]|nr:SDR family oxidoreductase [Halieaceae bacterium]